MGSGESRIPTPASSPMAMPQRLGTINRALAAGLGVVWCAGGAYALALAARRAAWIPAVAGLAGIAYGTLFFRVAWLGRLLEWPSRRRRQRPRPKRGGRRGHGGT